MDIGNYSLLLLINSPYLFLQFSIGSLNYVFFICHHWSCTPIDCAWRPFRVKSYHPKTQSIAAPGTIYLSSHNTIPSDHQLPPTSLITTPFIHQLSPSSFISESLPRITVLPPISFIANMSTVHLNHTNPPRIQSMIYPDDTLIHFRYVAAPILPFVTSSATGCFSAQTSYIVDTGTTLGATFLSPTSHFDTGSYLNLMLQYNLSLHKNSRAPLVWLTALQISMAVKTNTPTKGFLLKHTSKIDTALVSYLFQPHPITHLTACSRC